MNDSTFKQTLRLQVWNHAFLGAQNIIDLMRLYKREGHESTHCKHFITEKSLLGRTYSVKVKLILKHQNIFEDMSIHLIRVNFFHILFRK